jgi:hypothetical protein
VKPGLGRAPLAQQDDEVLTDSDQGADRAGEPLLDGNLVEVRLREPSPGLLVGRGFERLDERLASRKWR